VKIKKLFFVWDRGKKSHIFGISKCSQLYTFLDFNFPRKNENKKTILRNEVGTQLKF
jgi:hypothetical protein